MERQSKYEAIMKRAGEEWSEHVYFILCNALKVHATNNWTFIQFYVTEFKKCKDKKLKKMVDEFGKELKEEYLKLAWFVEPDHHY